MAIGLHILQQLQKGRDHLDSTIARLGRTAPYLVLNEHKLALELRAKGYDVLFRHQFDGDSQYRNFDVDRYWSVNGPLAEAGITVIWLNEPAINNTEDALLLLDAYQRTSRARPPGARMCVINAAVGTPHESKITDSGEVALLLREIVKNGDVLGLHEYAPQLTDTDTLKIRPWYLGRYRFWMDRCRGLGIAPPRVIITEFGYDTGGGSNDGWQGQKPVNEEAYAAFITEQAAEYRRAGYEVDACLYGWGDGFTWRSFNVEHSDPIIAAMAQANKGSTVTLPAPVTDNLTEWKDATLTPTDVARGVNMRSTADVDAGVPFAFPGGKSYNVGYDPTKDTPDKGNPSLIWKKVKYGAFRGYVRTSDAAVVRLTEEPVSPPVVVEPPNPNVVLTVAEYDSFLASLKVIMTRNEQLIKNAEAAIADLRAANEAIGDLRLLIADAVGRVRAAKAA